MNAPARLCVCLWGLIVSGLLPIVAHPLGAQQPPTVSFAKDVRPILTAKCFSCHQGARLSGGYQMTDFQSMAAGGDSGLPAIVAGDPENSYLLELITPVEGQAEMPPEGPSLTPEEIQAIRDWIDNGATSDYANREVSWSVDHPPRYTRQPVITSLDYSPDGQLLAVSGFHEVLLLDTTRLAAKEPANRIPGAAIAGRLVGLSARIESIRFSPDGTRLAVAGGNPGEFGEVQIWNVPERTLELSQVVTHDTISGISWSPDGQRVSFGCKDNSVRAIDAASGQQVLFQQTHEDWIRDTVFSVDGSQLVSVARDMSCKLTDVATQRFIDNISSITPGVLKGGLASVARHPERDEIVIGGADGVPKVYRMNRITKRVIGDDANLVRLLPALPGRIQSIAVSRDGTRIAAGSSLNGRGAVKVYSYEFDPAVPEPLQAILAKQPGQWTAEERQMVADYTSADVREISSVEFEDGGIYSVAFQPDAATVACGGADGVIRLVDGETGKLQGLVEAVSIDTAAADARQSVQWHFISDADSNAAAHREPPVEAIQTLAVSPASIRFRSPADYAQLVVTATLADGSRQDVTEWVSIDSDASVTRLGGSLVQPAGSGQTELLVRLGPHTSVVPVSVEIPDTPFVPDFRRDVNPVLTKLGCNAGTCHGSAGGKQGLNCRCADTTRCLTSAP